MQPPVSSGDVVGYLQGGFIVPAIVTVATISSERSGGTDKVGIYVIHEHKYMEVKPSKLIEYTEQFSVYPSEVDTPFLIRAMNMRDPMTWVSRKLGRPLYTSPKIVKKITRKVRKNKWLRR